MGASSFILLIEILDRVSIQTSFDCIYQAFPCAVDIYTLLLDYYFRTDRADFKMEPCKMKSILGWLVQMGDDPLHPDSFHLADPSTGTFSVSNIILRNLLHSFSYLLYKQYCALFGLGTMYKFRSGSTPRSLVWCRKLQECQKKRSRHGNLIRFD